jgi:hypothetical protein
MHVHDTAAIFVAVMAAATLTAASFPAPPGAAMWAAQTLAADTFDDLSAHCDEFTTAMRAFVATAGTSEARRTASGLAGSCQWPPLMERDSYREEHTFLGGRYRWAVDNGGDCVPRCAVVPRSEPTLQAGLGRRPVFLYNTSDLVPVPNTHFTVAAEPATCYTVKRLQACLFEVDARPRLTLRVKIALRRHRETTLGWTWRDDDFFYSNIWTLRCD